MSLYATFLVVASILTAAKVAHAADRATVQAEARQARTERRRESVGRPATRPAGFEMPTSDSRSALSGNAAETAKGIKGGRPHIVAVTFQRAGHGKMPTYRAQL